MPETKLSFSGVDYLRLTALDHAPYNAWHTWLLPEMQHEVDVGRRQHLRWVMGYYGLVGEHFFIGKSDAGAMVQVSGALANKLVGPLSRAGGKATRIDLQLTVPAHTTPSDTLMEAYVMASAQPKDKHRPPLVQINDTNYGAKMVTIGSRQSEVYGRIYDKYKESKEEVYRDMIRYEIEVKQPQSVDLHKWLLEDRMTMFHAKHIVTGWFQKRGVPVYWNDFETTDTPDSVKRTKNDDTKLAWIASQVRPSMRDLCHKGKALEVARAIAGKNATESAIMELASLLANVVSD